MTLISYTHLLQLPYLHISLIEIHVFRWWNGARHRWRGGGCQQGAKIVMVTEHRFGDSRVTWSAIRYSLEAKIVWAHAEKVVEWGAGKRPSKARWLKKHKLILYTVMLRKNFNTDIDIEIDKMRLVALRDQRTLNFHLKVTIFVSMSMPMCSCRKDFN